MKKILFPFLSLLFFVQMGFSQNSTSPNVAKEAAEDICECINLFFDELHPQLVQLMLDMTEIGEEEAQANFVAYLSTASEEEQNQIQADIAKMQNAEEGIAKYCTEVKLRYEDAEKAPDFEEKMLNELGKNPNCRLVWLILKQNQQKDE